MADIQRLHEECLLQGFLADFLSHYFTNSEFHDNVDEVVKNHMSVDMRVGTSIMEIRDQLQWSLPAAVKIYCKTYLEKYYSEIEELLETGMSDNE